MFLTLSVVSCSNKIETITDSNINGFVNNNQSNHAQKQNELIIENQNDNRNNTKINDEFENQIENQNDLDGRGKMEIEVLNHASVRLSGSKIVYIDPYQINGSIDESKKADLILITHSHYDHCSPEDMAKVIKKDTIIVAASNCMGKLNELKDMNVNPGDIRPISPYQKEVIGKVVVETIPAYNIGKSYHPKENNWVGFIVTLDGEKLYHAGDTDFIPDMKNLSLKKLDYAMLPVGGKYTMDAKEAANAANIIKAKVSIPIHYGSIVGSESDAELFKELCNGDVRVLK